MTTSAPSGVTATTTSWRELASGALNGLRERITGVRLTDPGCLLRAYDREIVEAMLASNEVKTSVPALACLYAVNPTEILVGHDERAAGESKYPRYRPIHLHLRPLDRVLPGPAPALFPGGDGRLAGVLWPVSST